MTGFHCDSWTGAGSIPAWSTFLSLLFFGHLSPPTRVEAEAKELERATKEKAKQKRELEVEVREMLLGQGQEYDLSAKKGLSVFLRDTVESQFKQGPGDQFVLKRKGCINQATLANWGAKWGANLATAAMRKLARSPLLPPHQHQTTAQHLLCIGHKGRGKRRAWAEPFRFG